MRKHLLSFLTVMLIITSALSAVDARAQEYVWKKVTDVSTLAAGDKVAIVNTAKKVAASTAKNDNNRKTTAVTFDPDGNMLATDKVLILELGGSEGKWTFKTTNYLGPNGYLEAVTGSSNVLQVNPSTPCTATISTTSAGVATIKFNLSASGRNWVRYNSSASCFSCYASGQENVELYKAYAAAVVSPITMTSSYPALNDGKYSAGTELTFSTLTESATLKVKTTIDGTTTETAVPSNSWTYTLVKDVTIDITAEAEGLTPATFTASYQVKNLTVPTLTVNPEMVTVMNDCEIDLPAIEGIPAGAGVTYTVEPAGIIEIANGKIKGLAEGEVLVTVATSPTEDFAAGETMFMVTVIPFVAPKTDKVVFDFTKNNYGLTERSSSSSYDDDGTTFSYKGITATSYGNCRYWNDKTYRIYTNNNGRLVLTCPEGSRITGAVGGGVNATYNEDGSCTLNSGSSKSVTIYTLTVNYQEAAPAPRATLDGNIVTLAALNADGIEIADAQYEWAVTATPDAPAKLDGVGNSLTLPQGLSYVWARTLKDGYSRGFTQLVFKAYIGADGTEKGVEYRLATPEDLKNGNSFVITALHTDGKTYAMGGRKDEGRRPGDAHRATGKKGDRNGHEVTMGNNGVLALTASQYAGEEFTYQDGALYDAQGNVIAPEVEPTAVRPMATTGVVADFTNGYAVDGQQLGFNGEDFGFGYEGPIALYTTGSNVTTGVDNVVVDNNSRVEYYNLQGLRVDRPTRGLYIRRQGNTATKVIL